MASKKSKNRPAQANDVPAADETARVEPATDVTKAETAVTETTVTEDATIKNALDEDSSAKEAATGMSLQESSLPAESSAGSRKKSKKAGTPKTATPKATPSKGKAPAPKDNISQTQEDADKPAKLSALDAAAKVLQEAGQPLNCQEMISAMAAKGYWTSPAGKTPASTLYSAIMRETQIKGSQARFQKTTRGHFVYQAPQAS